MKKITQVFFGILFLAQFSFGQSMQVPLETVKQFAGDRASVIWGNVYPDEPIPLYSLQDEVIGYSVNFSIGKSFPGRDALLAQCDLAASGQEKADRWMVGDFGNMLVSATSNTAPLVRYSKSISDDYAYGKEIQRLASAKVNGSACTLSKIYLMNILAKWYCYESASGKVYVKVFPPVEVYTEDEFRQAVQSKYDKPGLWQLPPDAGNEWQKYFNDAPFGPLVDHLIADADTDVPFYDWSFGCTPTAFSMALAYWDNHGMSSGSDYGNLVKYHLQRYDHVQGETDKNVPDLQRALAIAMNTDSMTGSTGSCCWLSGYISATNARGYSFAGSDLYGTSAQYWAWAVAEITAGRPFHMGTPGHSSTGVGYTDANYVIVHNTWSPPNDYFYYTSCDLVGTIVPGGQYGAAVRLTSPFGDPRYSDVATLPNQGEDLYAGDAFEITWDYDYLASSWVRLSYSVNAGTPFTIITSNTPNDGSFDWRIPSGLASSTLGRIKVEVLDASGVEAADGSYGNFDFHAGGSLYTLSEDTWVNTSTAPDYYQFTNTASYWSVVGVRPNISGEDWDIALYDNTDFDNVLASSSLGGSSVDFVVIDGNHTSALARGVKASRFSGSGSGKVEWEGGTDIITTSTPATATWLSSDVVEMYDVYLAPGYYKCTMVYNSGTANLGMAFYGSSSAAYYSGRSGSLALADSYGGGVDESFWINITTADYYGLCIFANDALTANFTVKFETKGQWLGDVSNDWFTPENWSAAFVPDATVDVTINTGYTYYPVIASGAGNCNNLTIGAGAKISIGGGDLNVAGNMTVYGEVEQNNANADFFVSGSILWESGSTANVTSGEFHLDGNWEFRAGAAANLAGGIVYFEGSASYIYIRHYDRDCSFNNVYCNKSAGEVYFSSSSADTLNINGYLYIGTDDVFYSNTNYPLVLKGLFYNYGHLECPYGTFIFDGSSHTINLNTGDYFNNLIISSSANVTLADSLRVRGDLTISSGALVAGAYPIFVGDEWNNTVGSAGFSEGTGKVVFNGGNYHQYCSNETFNILEVDKPLGGAFRVDGTTVTCASYDWTAGAVDVLSGTFTANDLTDSGIAGNYYVNPGGTINLYNTDGFIDLKGYLYIYGGNFNVYGGLGWDSYWPYFANSGVTMTGGILDFKDVGVFLYNDPSYTFTESITSGTIRTARGFRVERADYTPSGGTIEFYGPTDGPFHTINGGYVQNVLVNKTSTDNGTSETRPVIRDRVTGTVMDAPLTNSATLTGTAIVKGNLTIQNGVLAPGSNTMYVEGNWDNQVGTAGFIEGTSTVEFNGANGSDILSSETFYNLNVNKTYAEFEGVELMDDVTCNNLNITDGTMEINYPAGLTIQGNLNISLNAGLNANDYNGLPVNVGGHWTNANVGYSSYIGFSPGYSLVTFNGTSDQILTAASPVEAFYSLNVNKSAGEFKPNTSLFCSWDVEISNGVWEDNVSSLHHVFYHNFTVNSTGAFYNAYPLNTVEFAGAQNSVLTYSGVSGYFHDLLVTKSSGVSVTQVGNTSCQYTGSLTVENGIYNLNGYSLVVLGDVAVNDAGVLALPPLSTLILADGKSLNTNLGARLEITGTIANPATIRANVTTARYFFNVHPGATIAADYGIFKNITANGLYVYSGATIDPAHAFKGCTFQDGTAGGTLLTIDNNQTLTVRNAVFPTNTWGGASNVAKTLNQGRVYFVDYTGAFSGEGFDNDAFNRLDWTQTLLATATATPNAVCPGSPSQLNVNRSGGVGPYTYLWSPTTGLSNPAIINPVATPVTTTNYSVTVTDYLGTTATSSILLTVIPVLPVSVSVAPSANPSPPGNYVTFTATPVNGGAAPAYQWKVNGVNVGTGLPTYSYIPSYNDQVYCVLTSNYACPSGNPATSNVIVMIVVPVNTSVTGTVPSPLDLCFDATNTLTVAGGGTTFLVESGASVTLIAGVKISMLYGVAVQSGGYLHGYITTTNTYCGSLIPSFVAVTAGEGENPEEPASVTSRFAIYPNPSSGEFTLAVKGDLTDGKVKLDLLDMRGTKVFAAEYPAEHSHRFVLRDLSPGLYFVKVRMGDHAESLKLIVVH